VRVEVHELNPDLLEGTVAQQVPLNSRKRFVRVVVSLLNQPQLLSLRLVETGLDAVCLLEALEAENEDLCVVLIVQRWERDVHELS